MKFLPAFVSLTIISSPCLMAGAELRFIGRAGLFGGAEFGDSVSEMVGLSDSGWICGNSRHANGSNQAAWVTNIADGTTRRIGLFAEPEYSLGGEQHSVVGRSTNSGWLLGWSTTFPPGRQPDDVPWLANAVTGKTIRVGLTGPEFTNPLTGKLYNSISQLTESGIICGISPRFLEGETQAGQGVWVMDGAKGSSFRVGMFSEPEFTNPNNHSQHSDTQWLTESGWLGGFSTSYRDSTKGMAVWVAEAATGTTKRLGFFTGEEFVPAAFPASSMMLRVTESGWVAGLSTRWNGTNDGAGVAAWVAKAETGETKRIGLLEGSLYTGTGNRQTSVIHSMIESGWVCGRSDLHDEGGGKVGEASWVADAVTGATKRAGLFDDPEFTGKPSQNSIVKKMTESGWVGGISDRYDEAGAAAGSAAWVMNAATGITRRVGLTGEGFTSVAGEQVSLVLDITESGWASGASHRYFNAQSMPTGDRTGYALWVADLATGTTRQVGLREMEFLSASGRYEGEIRGMALDEFVYGSSTVYIGNEEAGSGTWAANRTTGITRPVGLTGGEFVRPGDKRRESHILGWTNSGHVTGGAKRYAGNAEGDFTAWVANAHTGRTFRPGLTSKDFTNADGIQKSQVSRLSESGLAAGTSLRFVDEGYIAWIFDINSGLQTTFDFPMIPGGIQWSNVREITADGLAYGSCGLRDDSRMDFLWAAQLGTVLLDQPPQTGSANTGWDYLAGMAITEGGLVAGVGKPSGSAGQGVFYGRIQAIADPPGNEVRVTGLVKVSESNYRLSFHTAARVRLTVQTSGNLTDWEDAEAVDAPLGESSLELSGSVEANARFWRLKTEPLPNSPAAGL